jgi:hypothetical protein
VVAGAINVGRFFHGLTLGAAVLALGGEARTDGVSTFCSVFGGHIWLSPVADLRWIVRGVMLANSRTPFCTEMNTFLDWARDRGCGQRRGDGADFSRTHLTNIQPQ